MRRIHKAIHNARPDSGRADVHVAWREVLCLVEPCIRSFWLARKVTTRRAAIGIASPVLGLRPGRCGLSRNWKFPKPESLTASSRSRASRISSKNASTKSLASLLFKPICSNSLLSQFGLGQGREFFLRIWTLFRSRHGAIEIGGKDRLQFHRGPFIHRFCSRRLFGVFQSASVNRTVRTVGIMGGLTLGT